MTFDFAPGFPPDIQGDVMSRMTHFANVVPLWCDRIEVKYDHDRTDAYAVVWVNYASRNACLAITGSYLDLSEDRRDRVMLHEFCHLYTCQISDIAKNILEEYAEGSALKVANAVITERLESATEDMAIMISRLLAGPTSAGGRVSGPSCAKDQP